MAQIDIKERLEDLYARNDQVEREIVRIDRHGRRVKMGEDESSHKDSLMTELNDIIAEIEAT